MKRLVAIVIAACAVALSGGVSPVQAQSACYHCAYTSTDGSAFCHPISPDGGQKECRRVPNQEICSFGGGSCRTTASLDVTPDGRLAGSGGEVRDGGADSGTGQGDVATVLERRPCDGAIVARRATPEVAAQIRERSRKLVI